MKFNSKLKKITKKKITKKISLSSSQIGFSDVFGSQKKKKNRIILSHSNLLLFRKQLRKKCIGIFILF